MTDSKSTTGADAGAPLEQLVRLTQLQTRMLLALRQYTRPGSGEWVPNIKFGRINKQACAVLCRHGLATRLVHSEQVRGERRVEWTKYQITEAGLRHLAA